MNPFLVGLALAALALLAVGIALITEANLTVPTRPQPEKTR